MIKIKQLLKILWEVEKAFDVFVLWTKVFSEPFQQKLSISSMAKNSSKKAIYCFEYDTQVNSIISWKWPSICYSFNEQ